MQSLKCHQGTMLLSPEYDGHHKQQVLHSNVLPLLRHWDLEVAVLWALLRDDQLSLSSHILVVHDHHAQTANSKTSQHIFIFPVASYHSKRLQIKLNATYVRKTIFQNT